MLIPGTHHRLNWTLRRGALEKKPVQKGLFEGHGIKIDSLARFFAGVFRSTPIYTRGFKNAAFPRIVKKTLFFDQLPIEFDGYTILQLTDLHLDSIPGLAERAAALIARVQEETEIDLCLLTGDYIDRHSGHHLESIMAPMGEICSAMTPQDGIFAILGNHDTWRMAAPFEDMGIRMLINETCRIRRGASSLALTGLDDPNVFYTPKAGQALENVEAGFKIALIHTPELYREAARNGFDLYLTGHTHGGQISLPNGRPIVLPLKEGRQFYKGLWQYRGMTGYTNQGLGTVSIPIRFNTFSEVTLIELRSTTQAP